MQRVARETGDPEIIERLKEQREEAEAEKFIQMNQSYHQTDQNGEALLKYLKIIVCRSQHADLSKAFRDLPAVVNSN